MYINANTLALYESQNEIRLAYPNTCFPLDLTHELLESFDIYLVAATTPVFNEQSERVIEMPPLLINGIWTQQWNIVPIHVSVEDKAAAILENLNKAKKDKCEEINQIRLAENTGTFKHLGHDISCDTLSRSDIETTNGIISLNNILPENWVGFWKTANNSYIPINTLDEWKAFYKSMFDMGTNNFIHAQQLKAMVNNATTVEEVEAIKW